MHFRVDSSMLKIEPFQNFAQSLVNYRTLECGVAFHFETTLLPGRIFL